MYLAELAWRRGCSVIRGAPRGLFSFLSNKALFGLFPLASSKSCDGFISILYFVPKTFFFGPSGVYGPFKPNRKHK